MKNYDKDKESLHHKYWNVNNLYRGAISQKLPVNGFKWVENISEFNEELIKNYNDESDEGYFLEIDTQCSEKLHDLHDDLPFLPERIKIEKVGKLVTKLYDKTEYFIYMRNLKQGLIHGLVLKKVHRMTKLNQKALLKPY